MYKKITAILLAFAILLLTGFKPSETSRQLCTSETILSNSGSDGLTFQNFRIVSINPKEVILEATTDNAGVKQTTTITLSVEGMSLSFSVQVLPNDRNVILNYKGSIKLK